MGTTVSVHPGERGPVDDAGIVPVGASLVPVGGGPVSDASLVLVREAPVCVENEQKSV